MCAAPWGRLGWGAVIADEMELAARGLVLGLTLMVFFVDELNSACVLEDFCPFWLYNDNGVCWIGDLSNLKLKWHHKDGIALLGAEKSGDQCGARRLVLDAVILQYCSVANCQVRVVFHVFLVASWMQA